MLLSFYYNIRSIIGLLHYPIIGLLNPIRRTCVRLENCVLFLLLVTVFLEFWRKSVKYQYLSFIKKIYSFVIIIPSASHYHLTDVILSCYVMFLCHIYYSNSSFKISVFAFWEYVVCSMPFFCLQILVLDF